VTAKILIPFLFCVVFVPGLTGAPKPSHDQCIICHEGMSDKPSTLFAHDIHRTKGIGCVDCHGGNAMSDDMEKAMDKKAGFIGVPKGDAIAQVCAQCHSSSVMMAKFNSKIPTNQIELLKASSHGKLALSGKERIAQCTTCHNAHGIAEVHSDASPVSAKNIVATCTRCHANAPLMRSYNPSLPVDQLEKYRTSVHGIKNARGDRKTAECASCHGSHGIRPALDATSSINPVNIPSTCAKCHSNAVYMKEYKIPTDQFEKFSRGVHGVALLQKHDRGAPACNSCHGNHGATPPGVESISKVCGTCHALNADLFAASPHKKAFDEQKLPECETCHGNHEIVAATEKLLGVSPEAVCSRCHTSMKNAKGYETAAAMRRLVDTLSAEEIRSGKLVDEAEQKGMEIGEAKFKLRDIRQARLQSRTVVHAFDEGKLRESVLKGLAISSTVEAEAQQAIGEYYFRRIGLGIATLIITIVGISLYLLIRRIERRQKK
jgi:predicted CXXCH cytochrome family protein